jgi:CheY-like chemotaxis protein
VVFLLVEDDPDDHRLLRRAVGAHPRLSMDHAGDVRQALAYLGSRFPFLVLSDIHLPGSSGWELLAWIRERSRMPVLLWTSLPTPDGSRRALSLGADGYVGKPKDLAGYHRIAAWVASYLGD